MALVKGVRFIYMKIITLENYYTSENTYIVYDENTMDGVIIDPGCKADDIKKSADKNGINIRYILITHCHYDHIEYLEDLRKITGAPLAAGSKASVNIGDPNINASYGGLGYELSAKSADRLLCDRESFKAGSLTIECIYTPGHTNCSVCYLIGDCLFSGDTLFLRSCGRWDLPTGDRNALENSIINVLYKLDDNIKVYPGHNNPTSIGYEKKFNFFVPEIKR